MRDRKNRAKDILYIHATIEIFAGHLAELRALFATEVRPRLQAKKAREVSNAAVALFGHLDDTVREAVQMVVGKKLSPDALTETCRARVESNSLIDGQTSTVFCLYFATNLRVLGVIRKPHGMRRLARIKTGAENKRHTNAHQAFTYHSPTEVSIPLSARFVYSPTPTRSAMTRSHTHLRISFVTARSRRFTRGHGCWCRRRWRLLYFAKRREWKVRDPGRCSAK